MAISTASTILPLSKIFRFLILKGRDVERFIEEVFMCRLFLLRDTVFGIGFCTQLVEGARVVGRFEDIGGLDCWCLLLLGRIAGRFFSIEFDNELDGDGFID